MSALDRALNWFVAPPPTGTGEFAAAPPGARADDESLAPLMSAPPRGGHGAVAPVVTSAAVLGRSGEAEPVAAALALALRVQTRARAAAVGVIGPAPAPDAGGGGVAAARRLAARLGAHGFEARARGRLAWVWLDPADPDLVLAARRVTLVAAPAVLAITVPRTAATDEILGEQDLVAVVASDPEGPLVSLATAGLPCAPVHPLRPLPRGPARALVRAGVRSPGPIRRLVKEPR